MRKFAAGCLAVLASTVLLIWVFLPELLLALGAVVWFAVSK